MTTLDSQVVFLLFFRPERPLRVDSQNEIYDIGTEMLSLTKNDHNSTQKAPKSIIPQEIKSAGHSPSSGSVKSRFKTIFKKWPPWIRRCCFHRLLSPEGDLPTTLLSERHRWHWDRNSFADEKWPWLDVESTQINNSAINQKRKTFPIIWQCQNKI